MPSCCATSAAWVSTCCRAIESCAEQRAVAREVDLARSRAAPGPARSCALGLGERDLIGPRVDLREEIALLDDLAFL